MEPEKKAGGAFVGLVIIVIILVLGGIYMWKVNKDAAQNQTGQTQTEATLTEEDSNDLNTLEQEANVIDANVGVDASTVN